MSKEVEAIISGALFGFAAFLTGQDQRVVASSRDNASPMVEALKSFMIERGFDDNIEPLVNRWQEHLSKNGIETNTIEVDKKLFKTMVDELKLLRALESAGVDNWEGYEVALESLDL